MSLRMGMTTWTIKIHAWWLLAYLAIGAVLWLPLEYRAWRKTLAVGWREVPFWQSLRHALRGHPWRPLSTVLLWPLAAWEAR